MWPCRTRCTIKTGFSLSGQNMSKENDNLPQLEVFKTAVLFCHKKIVYVTSQWKTLMHLSAAHQLQKLLNRLKLQFCNLSLFNSLWCEGFGWAQRPVFFIVHGEGSEKERRGCWACAIAASCGFTYNNIACTGHWASIDLRRYFFFPQI